MDFLSIVLDILILVVLAIPVVQGFRNGFVKTVLRFGRVLISAVLSCLFAKRVGGWLRDKWIYDFVYGKIDGIVTDEVGKGATIDNISDKLPAGLRDSLSAFGVDTGALAEDVAEAGQSAIAEFTENVASSVSGIVSVVLAFLAVFLVSFLLLLIVGALLNAIVSRIPIIKTINRWLGGVIGLLVGICAAWGVAQLVVAILGFFAMTDYSNAYILNFFHSVNPLRWLFRLLAYSLHDITLV